MDDIQQEKIISLIKDGDLSRLIPTLEGVLQKQEEQLTSTTDPTILLQTAIQAMQLDVLDYLLTLFFAQEGGKPKEGHLRLLGRVVILEALDRDRVPVFELLCRHDPALQTMYVGHTGPPLAWAAKFENLALVSFLLARGVEPNKTQIDHRPAVSIVAGWGSCAVMELLLDHGAVVSGTDALFNAAFQRRIDMLALLLETRKAADINSIQPVDYERELTPGPVLHLAVRKRNAKVVRMLIERFHADPLAKDSEGRTAFDWAAEVGNVHLLRKERHCTIS